MLLLDIMKETLEDYILKNFILLPGCTLSFEKHYLRCYINGVKEVNLLHIHRNDKRYQVMCIDTYGHNYSTCASRVYMNLLETKASRILYVK
jgi:hypothetical protein